MCIYVSEDRRIRLDYVIPDGKNLTVHNKSYIINEDDLFLYKGIPSYILTTKESEPVKINPLNQRKSLMSADDYNTAISSQVAKEIFLATKKGIDTGMISLIISGLTLVGLLVLAYLGNEFLTEIVTKLNELKNIIASFGVGG